jgi:hypothetical protein
MSELGKVILRHESKLGAKIFKKSKDSMNREFYCLNETTWVWRQGAETVFYKVNPTNVYKSNDGVNYRLASKKEASHLYKAAKVYRNLVSEKIYNSLLALG